MSDEAATQLIAVPTGREWREGTREDILALVRPAIWNDVLRVARLRHLHIEFAADASAFVSRVEATEPRAVLIDSSATAGVAQMQRFVRSLWPRARILVIAPFRSDAEASVSQDADAALHVPVRDEEWLFVLVRAFED